MASTKLSALALIAAVAISDVDVLPMSDIDGAPPTTYAVQIGELRTAMSTPSTDHTGTLGDATHRWTAVHADQLNLYTNGALTTSTPAINAAQTWNAGGQSFTAILLNITNTASAAGSLLADLRVGGVSQFSVDKGGLGRFAGGLTVAAGTTSVQALTASTGTFSGAVQVTGGTAVAGSLLKLSSPGLTLVGATGTDSDFTLMTPAMFTVFSVPTGTQNAAFQGQISSTSIIRNDGLASGFAIGDAGAVQRIQWVAGGNAFNFLTPTSTFANINAKGLSLDGTLSGTSALFAGSIDTLASGSHITAQTSSGVNPYFSLAMGGTNRGFLFYDVSSDSIYLNRSGGLSQGLQIDAAGFLKLYSVTVSAFFALAAGTYQFQINGEPGADRSVLQVGVRTITNGFTVDYVSGRMRYAFNTGDLFVDPGTQIITSGFSALSVDADNTPLNTRVFVGVGGIGLARLKLGPQGVPGFTGTQRPIYVDVGS